MIDLLFFAWVLSTGTGALGAAETHVGIVLPEYCSKRESSGPEEHTRECAVEPDCVASGFGLWIDGRFLQFDSTGDALALDYFETTKRIDGHTVEVLGKIVEDEIRVQSILSIEP